jgi:hypothetical protein
VRRRRRLGESWSRAYGWFVAVVLVDDVMLWGDARRIEISAE